MIAISLDDNDELAWVRMTNGDSDVVLVSNNGQAIRFTESDVRPMGRTAAGVIGMRLASQDRVIAFEVVDPARDLLVVSARGLGKRTAIDQYRGQGRGGKGIQAMRLTNRTGKIVAAGMVSADDSVMLMNTKGIAIRIPAEGISRIGRATQGVTLMRLGDDEEVASMTIIEPRDPASSAKLNGLEESAEALIEG